MSTSEIRHLNGLILVSVGASETLAAIPPALMYLIEAGRRGKPYPGGYR